MVSFTIGACGAQARCNEFFTHFLQSSASRVGLLIWPGSGKW